MSTPLRTFVIANPTSGAGEVERNWSQIDRLLRSSIDEFDYAFTRGEGHATLLAEEALEAGWEMIVALGGDGTINEVVNGFFKRDDPRDALKLDPQGWLRMDQEYTTTPHNPLARLGVIPMGTGGDFRKTLGTSKELERSIRALRQGRDRQIDVCQLGFLDHNGQPSLRHFINIAGVGLPGAVDEAVAKTSKRLGGTVSFAMGTLRALSRWENIDVEVELDGELLEQRINSLVVANGQYFGGGMWVAPSASLQDGKMQVVTLGDLGRVEVVKVLGRVYSGRHIGHPKVWHRSASSVAVRQVTKSKTLGLLDIDGEQLGSLPACFRVWPGMMHVRS